MSGHIFFKERWFGFDDGLYAAARMLEIIAKQAQPTSTLFSQLPNDINTPEIVVHLAHDGQQHEFIQRFVESCSFTQAEVSTIDGIRADFPDGWGLVRASNTTPSIVIRFEAKSEAALTRIKNEFKRQILAIDNSLNLPI
jgi:phosphomannomutase/phosphoglucomutase